MNNYVLDADNNPKLEPDIFKWARWFETAQRHVGHTVDGDMSVSTVFLGTCHNFSGKGPPVLWETMVFAPGHPLDGERERWSSLADAVAGHVTMCDRVWPKKEEAGR